MINAFKIIGILVLSFFTEIITSLLLSNFSINLPTKIYLIVDNILPFLVFVIYFSFFWVIFLREKNPEKTFFQNVKLKKVYVSFVCIIGLLCVLLFIYQLNYLKSTFSQNSDSHFIGKTIYENSKYKFRLTYPEDSVFAHANPKYGFITRFFIKDGQIISNDQENVSVSVAENNDLEKIIQTRKDEWSKFNPIDIQKVQFGGQDGYRMIFVNSYDYQRNIKELSYLTIKDGVSYELNYFPVVDQNIPMIDNIAKSFEFIK